MYSGPPQAVVEEYFNMLKEQLSAGTKVRVKFEYIKLEILYMN